MPGGTRRGRLQSDGPVLRRWGWRWGGGGGGGGEEGGRAVGGNRDGECGVHVSMCVCV